MPEAPKLVTLEEMIKLKTLAAVVTVFFCSIIAFGAQVQQGPHDADTQAVEEVVKARAEMQKAYDSINTSNPMSEKYQGGKPGAGPSGLLQTPTDPNDPMARLQKILNNPAVQGYLKIFSNPIYMKAVDEITAHPNKMILLYCEIALFLLFIILRAWRLSKVQHWARRILVRTYALVFYLGCASFVLPWTVLGNPYLDLLCGFWEAFTR